MALACALDMPQRERQYMDPAFALLLISQGDGFASSHAEVDSTGATISERGTNASATRGSLRSQPPSRCYTVRDALTCVRSEFHPQHSGSPISWDMDHAEKGEQQERHGRGQEDRAEAAEAIGEEEKHG